MEQTSFVLFVARIKTHSRPLERNKPGTRLCFDDYKVTVTVQ